MKLIVSACAFVLLFGAARAVSTCTSATPCPSGAYYYCSSGPAKNGCRPYSQGAFPSIDCSVQCLTGAAAASPNPSPNPSPVPSPAPSPASAVGACPAAVNCPFDGNTYYYCSSGAATTGCRAQSQGPWPAADCSAQCTFNYMSTAYLPPQCAVGTVNSCPQDGQSYYFCQTSGGCQLAANIYNYFPPAACSSQCLLVAGSTSRARTFNVINKCSTSVWVASIAYIGSTQVNPVLASGTTSWRLAPGSATAPTRMQLSVQPGTSGRLWGRTGCEDATGMFKTCKTGDCAAQVCVNSGLSPATLFEWTFSSSQDVYDISAVDGYNLPMTINVAGPYVNSASTGCSGATCKLNTANCPAETRLMVGSGAPDACFSICSAVYSASQRAAYPLLASMYTNTTAEGKMTRDLVCCACGDTCGAGCGCGSANCAYGCSPYINTPQYSVPPYSTSVCRVEEWPLASNGQSYIAAVKQDCPGVYAWQFDDANGLHYCNNADFDITFC